MQEIPVLLLTGYLGSGKTTLLNRILSNKRGIKFAVIVNDIGEVNIDADLIEKGGVVGQQDDSLVALQNGCICCTLKMDLVKQLQDIIGMQRFDYIVIEASGICEPGPIAQTICSIPQLAPDMAVQPRLDAIVTVVDALRMKDEFGSGLNLKRPDIDEEDIENLVIQQIEFCNIILLNKASEVSDDERGRIRSIIREIQPKAEIIDCNYGDVELDKIINTMMFDFDEVATSATWIQEVERHDDDDDDDDENEHHHHHDHDHHHHHHDGHHHADEVFDSFGYETAKKFSPDFIRECLEKLGDFGEYGQILRAKGIVEAEDGQWIHFDYVPGEPDVRYGSAEVTGRIVVIGAGVEEEAVKELFGI